MSYDELCDRLRTNSLRALRPDDILPLVEAILDAGELEGGQPVHETLLEIEQALVAGKMPVNLLLDLTSGDGTSDEDPSAVEELELRYRRMAATYPKSEWCTAYYSALEAALADPDPDAVFDFADELEEKLTEIWTVCKAEYDAVDDLTAEVVVGHRLLRHGYCLWIDALIMLETESTSQEILSVAESALRLLTAVEHLNRDLETHPF